MTVEAVVESLRGKGAIGIIRARSSYDLLPTIEALRRGGLACIEVTMNTPGALDAMRAASRACPDLLVGAGTVIDVREVAQAAEAGARFIVTPVMNPDVVLAAIEHECVVICGAMTPTEAYNAWMVGAHFVKIFPADVLGPAFIRAMQGPLPQIPLVPTGGVTASSTPEFIRAGAAAVCAGGWLVSETDIHNRQYDAVTQRARALCAAICAARASLDAT